MVKGKHYMDRAWYAIKVIGFDKEELGRVIREVRALASLPTHPHIVAYKCCWVENVAEISDDGLKKRLLKVREGRDLPDLILCVRLEYCEGNFDDYVNHRNNEFFRNDEFRSQRNLRDDRNFTDQGYQNYKAIFVDILDGLSFLHKRNIIHGNIKPTNVLYDKEMEFKITDFGFAKYYDSSNGDMSNWSRCGTMSYAASFYYDCIPEQILMKPYGLAADIVSSRTHLVRAHVSDSHGEGVPIFVRGLEDGSEGSEWTEDGLSGNHEADRSECWNMTRNRGSVWTV